MQSPLNHNSILFLGKHVEIQSYSLEIQITMILAMQEPTNPFVDFKT